MSLFQYNIGQVETLAFKIDDGDPTTIVGGTADVSWLLPWLMVSENAGQTPNLTVDLYDGSTAYALGAGGSTWVAKQVTAKQSLLFSDLVVPRGWSLRVTSGNSSGYFDVVGTAVRKIG